MRYIRTSASFTACLAVLLALSLTGCDQAAPTDGSTVDSAPLAAANGNAGPSANGSGHYTIQLADGSDFLRRFTFNAREDDEGDVTGRFNLQALGGHFQGDVTCASFFDNVAVLAGFVTRSGGAFRVGGNFVTIVEDNGEGGGDSPDRITPVAQFFIDGEFNDTFPDDQSVVNFACSQSLEVVLSFFPPLPLNEIEAGNVQVRP